MFRERPFNVVLFCSIVTLCTAVLQYLMPNYIFFDGGFIVVILLTVFLKQELYTIIFGIISMVLVFVSFFYNNADAADRQQMVLEHVFSIVIMLLTTVAVLYVKNLYLSMESQLKRSDLVGQPGL
jgi:hypothetical protein